MKQEKGLFSLPPLIYEKMKNLKPDKDETSLLISSEFSAKDDASSRIEWISSSRLTILFFI